MKRLMMTLAAALVATVIAAPVAAQNITAPGLVGPTACLGTSEVDTFDLAEVTNITSNSARFNPKNVNNLYSQLSAASGDGGPTSFPIRYTVHNAKTGGRQGPYNLGTVNSSNPNFGASSENASYPTKTPHYFTVFTTANGWGESRPLTRRCFMTGGTYTPANTIFNSTNPASTGCFTISPRTPQDVKNCLCGRDNSGTVGGVSYDYTSIRPNLGCAN